MRWALGVVPPGSRVVDPFAGSGSTLRAAVDLGFEAVGVELDEAFCEVAARRMAQRTLAGELAELEAPGEGGGESLEAGLS